MTDSSADRGEAALRQRIVAAVQVELDRHAAVVLAETDRLRSEAAEQRSQIERTLTQQIAVLGAQLEELRAEHARPIDLTDEQVDDLIGPRLDRLESTLGHRVERTETMIGESESRSTRRLEQLTADLDRYVDAAARPLLDAVSDEQGAINRRLEGLAAELRTFDEQAARMVVFVNELGEQIEQRVAEQAAQIDEDVASRVAGLDSRLEDAMALSLRQHVETTQRVNERTERIEERLSQRAFAFEDKLKQEAGQRIAEIDAHLGRVSSGLDDTIEVLTDRLARIEEHLDRLDTQLAEARAEFRSLDSDALEELKEKVSAAVGEATIVRIDMEKLEKSTTEHVDQLLVRMVALESELADATMDVNTAVQLERLEELERSVMELDPTRYVLKEPDRDVDQPTDPE